MSSYHAIGFLNIDADTLVTRDPCYFWGAVLLVSTTGGDVTIYEGQDANSGRKIFRLEGTADESRPVLLPKPILCSRGLFVDVGSNVTEVVVFWEPVPRSES